MPLKILAHFEPEQSFVLEPGDMLYLPPRYAHDGVAVGGDCMTYSIGLRCAGRRAAGRRPAGAHRRGAGRGAGGRAGAAGAALPRSRRSPRCETPAAMPAALQAFAREAVLAALRDPDAIDRALGESMTEPKANGLVRPGRAARAR